MVLKKKKLNQQKRGINDRMMKRNTEKQKTKKRKCVCVHGCVCWCKAAETRANGTERKKEREGENIFSSLENKGRIREKERESLSRNIKAGNKKSKLPIEEGNRQVERKW